MVEHCGVHWDNYDDSGCVGGGDLLAVVVRVAAVVGIEVMGFKFCYADVGGAILAGKVFYDFCCAVRVGVGGCFVFGGVGD